MLDDLLQQTSAAWGIALSPEQIDQFDRYGAALQSWNEHTNLTAITDQRGIVVRHFLDSLALAQIWPDQPPASLADIGTGAGSPGIPLKIIWPHIRLLLVESIGKKTEFLHHIVRELGLTDVEIVTARAEEIGRDPHYREEFAAVTARAVASLNVLVEYCLPLCAIGGTFVAPKGANAAREAAAARAAIEQLGGRITEVLPIRLPEVDDRFVVVVHKQRPTPGQYPRRTGTPSKRPL